MKFGLHVAPFADFADPRVLADLARDAEDAGWDGFFIYDHIARPEGTPLPDPWIALAAMAMQTERIRLGALVTPLARRRPWIVARETASLDHLSGGRLVVGVGAGHRPQEFDAFGDEPSARGRAAMLDEALEVLTGLWTGTPFTHAGTHYRVSDATFLPTPIQQPRIPIWVGGRWPRRPAIRRAARWDGAFLLGEKHGDDLSPSDVRSLVALIGQARTDSSPFDVVQLGSTGEVGATPFAPRDYEDAGATWWLEDIHTSRFEPAGTGWPARAMRDRIRQGPPRI